MRPSERRRSVAASAPRRQARTGTIAPTTTELSWADAKVAPNCAIGIAARKVGRGSQTSKAGRGNVSGGVP